MFVSINDCPDDFFDPACGLDARVELVRCIKSSSQSRSSNTNLFPGNGSVRWSHPTDSVSPINSDSRGGDQHISRRSAWSLNGLINHEQVGVNDPLPNGRIPLEDYHQINNVFVRDDETAESTEDASVFQAPTSTTGKAPSSRYTISQIEGRRPAYHAKPLIARYAFRISINDLSSEENDRVHGPLSQIVVQRPSPFPVWPTGVAGVWNGQDVSNLIAVLGEHIGKG